MRTASSELFGIDLGADEMYNRVRNPPAGAPKQLLDARNFSERLWHRTADYLDIDLPEKAAQHFHQAFWEMYLAAILLELGLPLVPRSRRKTPGRGPDLQIAPNIWVEAIAVTAGSGPDAVPSHHDEIGKVYDVPERELRLRLVSGMTEKRNKFESYRSKGLVGADDICVVAINGAMLPIYGDFFPPRIIRALMEFGWPQAKIDLETRKIVEHGHMHQPSVNKLSGSAVAQGMFRDGSCSFLSACIYSGASYAYAEFPLGCDFIVVHNSTATVPLNRELITTGDECWIEGEALSYRRHKRAEPEL